MRALTATLLILTAVASSSQTLTTAVITGRVQEDEIVVSARRGEILNESTTGASLSVSRRQMDDLPHSAATFEDAARLSPYISGGSALGRNERYNDLHIDGASFTDQFGALRGRPTLAVIGVSPINLDAVQEFQVDLAPFDVRQSGFTGASITAVTRGGTKTVQGSMVAEAAPGWAAGTNPDDGRRDFTSFLDMRAGFQTGGPLGGRGAFYYVAGEINRLLVPVDRQFGSSISGGTTFTTPASAIQQFGDTLRFSHGYDAGSMDHVLLERNSASIFSRLDFTLSPKHHLTVRYSFFRSQTDRPPDIAGVYAGNTVSENVTTAHTATAELSSILEDDFLNELFLGYTARNLHSLPVGEPFPFLDVSVIDPRRHWNHLMAGSDGGAVDGRLVDHMLELRNTTTLFRGSHCLTFGMHHEIHWFDSFFLDDQYGHYTFDAIADVARLKPREYEFRYVRSDAAREGTRWRALQLGAYLQDEWWVSPRVRLSAGVRVDVPLFLDIPGENPAVGETLRPLGFDVRTSRLPMTRPLFSPRIAWNIDPAGDRSSQIRGGVGVLTGRVPFIWLSNQFAHSGLNYVHVREVVAPPPFVADPARQPRPGDWPSLRERSEINITDPDFVFPQVLRGTLAIDFSLPWNLVASAEVVFSRSLNDVTFRNINLKTAGRLNPELSGDRRPLYGTYQPSPLWDPGRGVWIYSRTSDAFTNVILLSNTDGGSSLYNTI